VPHPGLHRAERLAQVLGELGMRQAVEKGERDRLALPGFQPAQAAGERRGIAAALELGQGAGVVAFQTFELLVIDRLRIRPSQPVEAAVAHDARHPGHGRGAARAVFRRVPPHADVAFLQHFLGPVFTPQYTQGDAEQFRRRGVIKCAERAAVAQRAAGEEGL